MNFAPELALLYAQFGEPVLVAGSPVVAVFDGGYLASLDVQGTQPSIRCRAADVASVAVGAAVVRGAVNYVVRAIEPLPPDELEKRLILERQ